MSKPISFGFGKSKIGSITSAQPAVPKPISISTASRQAANGGPPRPSKPSRRALHDGDSENEDDLAPVAETVLELSSGGVILTEPKKKQEEKVIVNSGNGDWRKRGRKNLLPSEVQSQQEAEQNGGKVVTTERNEVSTSSGLQYAVSVAETDRIVNDSTANGITVESVPEKVMSEDERALAALLDDESGKLKSNAVIATQGNVRLQQRDETTDFREDVAMRPESATLEEYAAMPVEEFGMAMLRGMGRKRKANGEIINLNGSKESNKKTRKQEGFLGIGAKPAPGLQGVELGAWGKADMRKNNRGEGFFTPVMMEDKRTGERITEEEFERRKKEAKDTTRRKNGDEADWRERRDRNLGRNGRNDKELGSKKRNRDDEDREHESSGSGRDRERNRDRDRDSDRHDKEYRKSKSRQIDDYDRDSHRSRQKEPRQRDNDRDHDCEKDRDHDRDRDRDRDRHRNKYGYDRKHESGSSRKGEHNERYRERERKSDEYYKDDRRKRDR